MTVEVEVTEATGLMINPAIQDGIEGYNLALPGQKPYFISEHAADSIGRYFLFGNRQVAPEETPVDPGENPDEDPIDAEPVSEIVPNDTEPTFVDRPQDTPPVAT